MGGGGQGSPSAGSTPSAWQRIHVSQRAQPHKLGPSTRTWPLAHALLPALVPPHPHPHSHSPPLACPCQLLPHPTLHRPRPHPTHYAYYDDITIMQQDIGRGYDRTKKEAKKLAALVALEHLGLCPPGSSASSAGAAAGTQPAPGAGVLHGDAACSLLISVFTSENLVYKVVSDEGTAPHRQVDMIWRRTGARRGPGRAAPCLFAR